MRVWRSRSAWYAGAWLIIAARAGAAAPDPLERRPFDDVRNPPSYLELDAAAREQVDLGHAVFNTQWVAAGTANSARHDGLGPLFSAAACDACHNEGAHGRGPTGDGRLPASMIIQLRTRGRPEAGDPVYGRALSTSSLEGFTPEAVVGIRYRQITGRYPDGQPWQLRVPHYSVSELSQGPLAGTTILGPRIAPALFGVGLLEKVTHAPAGRFGWQGATASVRAQTTRAFAQDMGLTSEDVVADDCTPAQAACRMAPQGGVPEVEPELLDAVLEFQRTLAVPSARVDVRSVLPAFVQLGCSACHQPSAATATAVVWPYTDLQPHDLGRLLDDLDVSDRPVVSRWRTAPLWGMAYRLSREQAPTFLHDGRARSVEEAILWHGGEAAAAKQRFQRLKRRDRQVLLEWVGGL